jgi:conjugal transfer pilus assembly protein TraA
MKRTFFFTFFWIAGLVTLAYAGTGGTEFTEIYDTIVGWTSGALGKTIAIGAFLTGIAMGIVRQSIMAVVIGISTALAVNYTPTIIDSVVVALIP